MCPHHRLQLIATLGLMLFTYLH
uniref:Uncharacterized protein n=1 Tax=Arundo donax TaxID=35708 RepID=A0A0A9E7Q8_ARUDO